MASQPPPAEAAAALQEIAPTTLQPAVPATTITIDSPLPDPVFTTKRLIVRPLHPQDVESLQRAADRPSISKYMSLAFGSPYTMEHARNWINMNLTPPINNFGLFLPSAPKTSIGGIGLIPGKDVNSHTVEIGYWLAESHWGQGYTTEALAAMVEYVFTQRERPDGGKFSKVFAGAFSANRGSMRCMEKCGFRSEGVWRGHVDKGGDVYDLCWFGLLKGEWEEWRRERGQGCGIDGG